ncbi:MAG: protein kinase family protein [Streptosporangiaceae bacterium]
MSTYTSEPGTRLAGRYRLVDQMSAGAGWTYWKATDETLARPVTVLTFAAGFPRIAETATAARAASRVGSPHLAQVFDVEDAEDLAYLVMEWVVGESLLDMLSDGPLESLRAAALIAEAARALVTAHANGQAHLRLAPACLHWTPGGGVKISGLGIDAALAGPAEIGDEDAADTEQADARGLARLLYAALTGYWPAAPGADGPAEGIGFLPPAPVADRETCTPSQVSAAVPANIDDVTCRALFQRPSRHGPALSTPAMLAEALAEIAPPASLLSLALPPPGPMPAAMSLPAARPPTADGAFSGTGFTNPYPTAGQPTGPVPGRAYRKPLGRERSMTTRLLVGALIVIVLAAIGVAGYSISRSLGHGSTPKASGKIPTAPSAASAVLLKPASANSFDPLGAGGDENGNDAKYAIDGNPSTFWHTDFYDGYPRFGNLKKGTGLILDMGKTVRLSQLVVQFGSICCAHVDIEIGNDAQSSSATLASFTQVATSSAAAGSVTFNVTSSTTGRYVLIWITYLPRLAGTSNEYQAQIYNVVVHGSVAGQSG